MAQTKTTKELEHSASDKSGFFSVRGQSHSGSVTQEPEEYQSVSSRDFSSVMRRWDIETPITDILRESQCESASITDMCSVCAAKGIGKTATHICRDCSRYGRYYCQSCWDYHNKFLPNHDTLSLSVSSERDDEIKMWLNELKQQIEKDEYNDKAFDKKPNGNSESAKLSVILKEICTSIQRRSKCQSIETEVASLLEDIKAWDDTKPPKKANGKACKVVEALRESRSKLRERILEFKSIETEVASLLEDIKAWDDTKPPKKANGNACKVVEALRESRSKLRERKLQFKSFQLRFVRKEDYNDLEDQMRTLHEKMRQLREDKESAYNR